MSTDSSTPGDPMAGKGKPFVHRLYNENGSRNVAAERELENTDKIRADLEVKLVRVAELQSQLGKQEYIPPTDPEAQDLYRAAQRRAAAMSDEVLTHLRDLMLNSRRPTVRLDAAKALWEIAGRIMGGDGKRGSLPGSRTTFVVVDKNDMISELEKRRREGSL